jgi:hypothetical protein
MMFGSSAWSYWHRNDLVIKKPSVPISTYNGVLDLALFLTIQMALYLGVAFFIIGYMVWKAYRKYGAAKKNETHMV